GALLIGIIQYAAVAEHLNEYALKKALGARGKHLFLELLLRSSTIGLAGGTLGLIIGMITLAITAVLIDQPAYITPWALPTALAATTILGGLGGTAAATRAARISPTTVIHP
ncbi:ABC transporter permease, partial [Dermatophilus congolensis]